MAGEARALDGELDPLFRAQRRFLWAIAYRVTGTAADADDIVQNAFVRLAQASPAPVAGSLRAWLVRVVTHLAIDALRRRRRRRHAGPWLPGPI